MVVSIRELRPQLITGTVRFSSQRESRDRTYHKHMEAKQEISRNHVFRN